MQECCQATEDGIQQGIAAGFFKPAEPKNFGKTETHIPVRDGSIIRALLYRLGSGSPGLLLVMRHSVNDKRVLMFTQIV